MGVGTPTQLLKMVGMGADMFDCVMPSRAARHGMAYTTNGTLNLKMKDLSRTTVHWTRLLIAMHPLNFPNLTSDTLSRPKNLWLVLF